MRVRGREIPLMAVLGALGTFAAWVSVLVLHPEARTVGLGWMAVGLTGYFVYRRRQGLDPGRSTGWRAASGPRGSSSSITARRWCRSSGTDVDVAALRGAAKLVGEGATVDVVYVLRVPPQLSLDAGLAEEEDVARTTLEAARVSARRAGLRVRTRMVRARRPGPAIVEEAKRQGAEVIYLGTVHAPPSERALGPTAAYVLAHRPCRVIVETPPAEELEPVGVGMAA